MGPRLVAVTTDRQIRNIAVGLLVRDGHVLAEEYPPIPGHHRFVRAIGGGIEFGERAEQAVRREFAEELGVQLETTRLLGVSENIFQILDSPGHQVVHLFAVRCRELADLPLDRRRPMLDHEATVGWYALDDLAREAPTLYPAGALAAALRLHDTPEADH